MPYSIQTKDGIKINNIPDDIAPDSDVLKQRVMEERAKRDGVEPVETQETGMSLDSIIEPAVTVATGALGEVAGGLAGLAQSLNPFAEEGAGAEAVDKVRSAITVAPQTEEGKAGLEALGETVQKGVDAVNYPVSGIAGLTELIAGQGIDQAIATLNNVKEQGMSKALGNRTLEITGSPTAAAVVETLPTAIGAATGAVAASPAKAAAQNTVKAVEAGTKATTKAITESGKSLFKYQSPTKQKIAELIKSKSGDASTAKFKLSGDKVVKDKTASGAINQGFDEGVVAAVKGASKADKTAMLKMVDIMERGKKNARYAALNRPADVAGDTLMNRFKVIRDANRKAGSQLDDVAKSLRGQAVDHSSAVDSFLAELDSMGVRVNPGFKLDFNGSIFEGTSAEARKTHRVLQDTINRMAHTRTPDAYDVHRLKKFIDSQVNFSKSASGMPGRAEVALKNLRHNVDALLDGKFAEYDRVNTVYAETRGAIDALQDVAGRKMNLSGPNADKATGVLLRRLMSNAQSRITLLDAVNEIESVAAKHGGWSGLRLSGKSAGNNDLLTQVLFVDELDSVFGPVARTSLQGQELQALKQAANAATSKQGMVDAGISAAGKVADKVRGVNQEGAFKAIRELLGE